ncbi:MAG: Nif3-like dinuclear metal center hexameric protein [Pseudomonadota bacterium]
MTPTLSQVLKLADSMFPFSYSEPWDNSGVQIGDLSRQISSIVLSLDPSIQAVRFAAENKSELLISHHPLLLKPINKILFSDIQGNIVLSAARSGVDILSLHTNLDAAEGGLNDFLVKLLDLYDAEIPDKAPCARLARLRESQTISILAQKIGKKLGLDSVRTVGPQDRIVNSVFLVSGSGMGYLQQAIESKADVIVTGDVRYHGALDSQQYGIAVIDAGHFGLEKFAVDLMTDKFEEEFLKLEWKVRLTPFKGEKDPFIDVHCER